MMPDDGAFSGEAAASCAIVRAPPPDELSAVLAKFPGIPYQVRMHTEQVIMRTRTTCFTPESIGVICLSGQIAWCHIARRLSITSC